MLGLFFFFFSSRRRHTILQGDWSSDVCSSDLGSTAAALSDFRRFRLTPWGLDCSGWPGPVGDRARRGGKEEGRVGEKGGNRGGPGHLKKKKKRKEISR